MTYREGGYSCSKTDSFIFPIVPARLIVVTLSIVIMCVLVCGAGLFFADELSLGVEVEDAASTATYGIGVSLCNAIVLTAVFASVVRLVLH